MAQNITLLGASYSAVPAVTLPKTGGGTASFTDVTDTTAAAADVASGKYFYTAAGVRTAGTSSGGGGSGLTLLVTSSLGALSTSSTSSTDTGKTITVEGYNAYDLLIVDVSVDSTTNGRHTSTVSMIYLTGTSAVSTKNTYTVCSNKWNSKLSSSGTATTRQSTNAYGICANSATVSNSKMTIPIYYRYNSTHTSTINGNYTARVYGVKLYDLIGG